MKKYVTLIFCIFLFYGYIYSENLSGGARPLALSNAFVAIPDIWSIFHNQAGIAGINEISGAVFYTSRFGLKELAQMTGVVILPFDMGTFGLSWSRFGTGTYRDTKLGLAFAKKLGRRIDAGIQLDYFALHLPENKQAATSLTFEGGLLYKPGENLHLGIHVFNPVKSKYNKFSEENPLSLSLRLGGGYTLSDYVMISCEAEKRSALPALLKTGLEVSFQQNFVLRAGVSGKPFAYTAGFGYKTGRLKTDIAFYYHGNLGISPAISIQYSLK